MVDATMSTTRQKQLVLILARAFASNLSTPTLLADARGYLVYYNEAAELAVGRRFAETGELPLDEWLEPFAPRTSLRLAGTAVPGVLAAGTFYGQGMKQFLYLRRPQGFVRATAANVLVLDLHDMFYGRVVLSCAEADARRVIGWAKAAA